MKKINKNLILISVISAFIIMFSFTSPVFAYGQIYYVPTGVDFIPDPNTNINNDLYPGYPVIDPSVSPNNIIKPINEIIEVNPSPIINSISPEFANRGSESITVTITGENFITSSISKWDNFYRPTSYLDSKHLIMTLYESDLATAGTYLITVYNPAPGGGISNGEFFTVRNETPSHSLNLGANAFDSGFMPSSLLEWLLFLIILILIILLIRRMFKKQKITLTASNITATSVTLNATGLTPNATYMLQVSGPLGPSKIQVTAGNDGTVSASFSNLTPGSHYTGTLSKYDTHTNFLSSAGAPTLYFDTFKQA